ncbi:N-acetylmuramoyl-L-alanine amidase [Bacillus rubiinfantis]|uniref:N-acetylmuramoyl-L-alanine amidase n=1 Tax=Bacillus rubiinfantis TaxID=1499680 RepID=UPI0005A6758E|nr:N-acetylmuramoyl-L-alanine amidase [Bacillus rubiinfantis]
MKLYLDPGHGGQDPGAQGNGLNEKDITLDIALKLRKILQDEYENVEVKMSRTSDTTKSLNQRTTEANSWHADFYLAIHINSAGSSAQGYEDFIYSGLSDSSKTAQYQRTIHNEVMKVNELRDRGSKKANFHVLRESTMPAILTENGFITNGHDAGLMKQSSWQQKVARGHANGLAKIFNLKKKPTPAPAPTPQDPNQGTLYKVIAGSFKSRENAEEQITLLHNKGFEAFVITTTISGDRWYRVQAGAFSNRANAEDRLAELKKAGFTDTFLITTE